MSPRIGASALAFGLLVSCASGLDPGTLGDIRVMGTVRGDPPRVLPPTLDRDGNYYVLEGSIAYPSQTRAYVGAVGGGWRGSCAVTKGDRFGAHGWVGGTQSQRWYWSGDALVGVNGKTADCRRVLDVDPSTGASLRFLGVVPDVRDAPSTTSVVALIQSPSDLTPFSVLVDLRNNRYENLRSFQPTDATEVQVIGVGADRSRREGVMVVRYVQAKQRRAEVIVFDDTATELRRYPLTLPDTLGEYAVSGFLEFSDAGLGAAVIGDGFVLALAGGQGRLLDPSEGSAGFAAIGVHRFEGRLFVVGTQAKQPTLAPLTEAGTFGAFATWNASLAVQAKLDAGIPVVDDRTTPITDRRWDRVRSAIGTHPFLSAHSPELVAGGTVAWAFAGPFFTAAGESVTQIGIGPVGISYP